MSDETHHGTGIVVGEWGVLIRGRSGSGKSTLALMLLDQPGQGTGTKPMKAKLVSDDQVQCTRASGEIHMMPPYALRDRIEVRGLGIVRLKGKSSARLHAIVDYAPEAEIERMPETDALAVDFMGTRLPRIFLNFRDPSAPARLRTFLIHHVALRNAKA